MMSNAVFIDESSPHLQKKEIVHEFVESSFRCVYDGRVAVVVRRWQRRFAVDAQQPCRRRHRHLQHRVQLLQDVVDAAVGLLQFTDNVLGR